MTARPSSRRSPARALGAYDTPPVAALLLARWALRNPGDRVLEPSMGRGAFLQALDLESRRRRLRADIWGVELATETYATTMATGAIAADRAIRDDFLAVEPFEVDAVVGNPPYVRLRHLPPVDAQRARAVAERVLGEPMDQSGSVWMPFILHATRFLARGGRLAFVLPYDLTYVRYARPLWRHLGGRFGSLRVVRVHERMFPELFQEAVLLLADDFGSNTDVVDFAAYRSVAALERDEPETASPIAVEHLVAGRRAFLEALLRDDVVDLLRERVDGATVPARQLVTFNSGYVCGDKGFFHPTPAAIEAHGLPDTSLRSSLTSSRQLRGGGLWTSTLPPGRLSRLFVPAADPAGLAAADRAYIDHGDDLGVPQRYKCRTRDPWYVTPYIRVPDVVVPVFTERPALLVNDGGLIASNSLLCGYLGGGTAEGLAAAWFTSLTLLLLELQVRALGGGVMVVVPREAGNVRLPVAVPDPGHLRRVHELLVADRPDDAFQAGDRPVLRAGLGLSRADIDAVREGAATLARWRTAVRTPYAEVGEAAALASA